MNDRRTVLIGELSLGERVGEGRSNNRRRANAHLAKKALGRCKTKIFAEARNEIPTGLSGRVHFAN